MPVVKRWYILIILAIPSQLITFTLNSWALRSYSQRRIIKSEAIPSLALHQTTKSSIPIKLFNKHFGIEIFGDLSYQLYISDSDGKGEHPLMTSPHNLSVIRLAGKKGAESFTILPNQISKKLEQTDYGESEVVSFTALSQDSVLSEKFVLISPFKHVNVIIIKSSLENKSSGTVHLSSYNLLNAMLDARKFGADSAYKFWSFQGGSYPERYDWILPITRNYSRQNFQGMNAPDYGGGIPLVDLWSRNLGIAFCIIDRRPQFVSLPVKVVGSGDVSFSIVDSNTAVLNPHKSVVFVSCAVSTHHGDFFNGLRTFSDLMRDEGFHFPTAPTVAFEPEWCAWGYGRGFNKEEILKSLPTVKKLGFGWVTIDDGWQNNLGDWEPSTSKFPGGEKEFEAFIDSIHSYGLKVRLWWSPFSAQDSAYSALHYESRMHEYGFNLQSRIALEHPDWFIIDRNGKRVRVSWWNSYLLCPAVSGVREYYQNFVRKAIIKWKIDGFKLDGQDLNMVPECYNRDHHHLSPFASVNAVPEFFKDIYDESQELRKGFLIQLCPCGTNFSFYNLPYVNQTVASDPVDSWQVRLKGKTFKALYGNRAIAYSGDHVELTNHIWDDKLQKFIIHGKPDFASAFAVGGVPASKFTIPGTEQEDPSLQLNPSMLKYYTKWMGIYKREKLANGVYLNLYDIAYDKPETHVITRRGNYYYFFFSKGPFHGNVTLRGLVAPSYKVYDLYTGDFLKDVKPGAATLEVSFNDYMILKVVPGVSQGKKKDGR